MNLLIAEGLANWCLWTGLLCAVERACVALISFDVTQCISWECRSWFSWINSHDPDVDNMQWEFSNFGNVFKRAPLLERPTCFTVHDLCTTPAYYFRQIWMAGLLPTKGHWHHLVNHISPSVFPKPSCPTWTNKGCFAASYSTTTATTLMLLSIIIINILIMASLHRRS